MAVIRTRFIIWLIKAYIKKWGRYFVIFFFLGLIIFFSLLRFFPLVVRYIPLERKKVIGLAGAFTTDEIPEVIVNRVARALTRVGKDGTVYPDVASGWKIENNGKKYIFHLKRNLKFSDGTLFTSKRITYSFKDVTITRPDDYTIVFTLRDEYAPFLTTVTKPIIHTGYIGIGDYRIGKVELNGSFIKSVQLISVKNRFKTEDYVFYPSADALKIAFNLGEASKAIGLSDTIIKNFDMASVPNINVLKKTDYKRLVTLFYNTQDGILSDKKLRNGLTYALPDEFSFGERVYGSFPPASRYFNISLSEQRNDISHANLLIDSSLKTASNSTWPTIHIKTLTRYRKTAEIIKQAWKKAGLQVTLEDVDVIPQAFQVYLGDFSVPKDPDQYTLWHTGQENNITRFKNLRIDKLLEDGRRNTDLQERLKIYSDFQKYLADESPASFLYFPYEYDISRK